MYGQLRALAEEAKQRGLAVVVWFVPAAARLSKEGETAIDSRRTPRTSPPSSAPEVIR